MHSTRGFTADPASLQVVVLLAMFCAVEAPLAGPARLWVETDRGGDSLIVGARAEVRFGLSADAPGAAGVAWPLEFQFTNGNIIGPLSDTSEIFFSSPAQSYFGFRTWQIAYGAAATDPDTTLCAIASTGPAYWHHSGIVWHMSFIPLDTGRIAIDSVRLPLGPYMDVVDPSGQSIPFIWEPKTLYVVKCSVALAGDVNCDGCVDLADLVMLGNALDGLFAPGLACVECAGDMNGNGSLDESDYDLLYDLVAGAAP